MHFYDVSPNGPANILKAIIGCNTTKNGNCSVFSCSGTCTVRPPHPVP